MYKDKAKQRESNKAAAQRKRDKAKGMTNKTAQDDAGLKNSVIPDTIIPQNVIPKDTFTDAAGNVHKVDYEGRRKDYYLLNSWREGKGTPYQQVLGMLSRQYSIIKSDFDKPGKLAHYLGLDYAEPITMPNQTRRAQC